MGAVNYLSVISSLIHYMAFSIGWKDIEDIQLLERASSVWGTGGKGDVDRIGIITVRENIICGRWRYRMHG